MPRLTIALAVIVMTGLSACSSTGSSANSSGAPLEVVLTSDVNWEQLNPARGDQSPRAGTLWGDRTGPGPGGFLLKPVDGFKSPPHIHNIAYRGVVISGLIHNDDPNAEEMYMPTGSFWTQPAGGVHITAARGNDTLAYIEVEDGFGVLPAEKAFRTEERPINVDVSNLVWVDQPGTPSSSKSPKLAYLWGSREGDSLNGTLVKLPAGFTGKIKNQGSMLRAVVVQGRPQYTATGKAEVVSMEPGSYFGAEARTSHRISCPTGADCIFYVRVEGKFDVVPVQP